MKLFSYDFIVAQMPAIELKPCHYSCIPICECRPAYSVLLRMVLTTKSNHVPRFIDPAAAEALNVARVAANTTANHAPFCII
jgi:hypothetical protein